MPVPVPVYGGDAAEMWEENSQKVIYEMSFQPVKTVQCHEARSISSAAHFFVTWDSYFKMIKCHI